MVCEETAYNFETVVKVTGWIVRSYEWCRHGDKTYDDVVVVVVVVIEEPYKYPSLHLWILKYQEDVM